MIFYAYFDVLYSLLVEGELISIEHLSLSVHGYQLLPLATSQLMGDCREFDASGIF